ncbi:MAG TPA: tetratricopeptide repeat protein [Gemmataceae bacterium]|nr:tetratricopeptide repeat protein [Gemmataceae bacterium]
MGQPAELPMLPRRAIALAALVFVSANTGCHKWHTLKERTSNMTRYFSTSYDDPQANEKMARAEQLFVEQQYPKAQDLFKELADNTRNNAHLAERARFMQAECRRLRGHYPESVDTYNRLLNDFPTGAHRKDACARMFEIADYWLDDFRDELRARANEKGVLRWRPGWPNFVDRTKPRTDQEGEALRALEHVHTHDVMGPVADKAMFWCGYVNYVRGNFNEADHFFSQLVEIHKDSPLRPQAVAYAIQAKNNATGGAVYDARKCAEALQLVHTAEATIPELTQDPAMAEKLTKAKFAIRSQQAEKDFKTAEYYERTGHPGSAVFYYELVRRRYAGTRYSDAASDRKDRLLADMQSGKTPANKADPISILQAKWTETFGKKPTDEDMPRDGGPVVPAGGVPNAGASLDPTYRR